MNIKKIAVIFNDEDLPIRALEYAISIAKHMDSTIFGLFINVTNQRVKKGADVQDQNEYPPVHKVNSNEDVEYINQNISLFSKRCSTEGVKFNIVTIQDHYLDNLIDYSAFTDLMLYDPFSESSTYSKNAFLANVNCPVLLINKDFKQIENVVLTFDDELSGLHAIKSFAYLFSSYNQLPTRFVSVLPENIIGLHYQDLIDEWLPLHFPNAKTEILKGNTSDELSRYIKELANPLVVMGAFGRTSLSRFFNGSLANIILDRTNAPVFIAHL